MLNLENDFSATDLIFTIILTTFLQSFVTGEKGRLEQFFFINRMRCGSLFKSSKVNICFEFSGWTCNSCDSCFNRFLFAIANRIRSGFLASLLIALKDIQWNYLVFFLVLFSYWQQINLDLIKTKFALDGKNRYFR